MQSWYWLGGSIAVAAAGLVVARRNRKPDAAARSESDGWLDAVMARQLAPRLGQRMETTRQVLAGERPELREEIDRLLHDVRISFARTPSVRQIEVRLEADLTDGRRIIARSSVPWAEAPAGVREELLRTAQLVVTRRWSPMWQSG